MVLECKEKQKIAGFLEDSYLLFQLLLLVSFPRVIVILPFNTKAYFLPVFLNCIEMELYILYFYILIFLAQDYVMRCILFLYAAMVYIFL